ncbi:hypothetical protein [Urbifossiella limnaea]|uniref:Uncharacterized protein n=1 Tax=Urbifossiella limnaea TaxID=2528023 RepID=A0A517XLH5_9BACT|nr:hypothetical protein [Urbifossiella limnaea]QDU18354.1 hypothetical protein ETAA1_02390 [Urbifossiella limnaea]
MIDRTTLRPVPGTARLMFSGRVGRCDVCIFTLEDAPRVFVGGGVSGYDGLVNEVDRVAAETLADQFGLSELREVAARIPSSLGS